VPFIQLLAWGTHVCVFYSSPQDLVKLLVPYFEAGLMHNEFCLWVTAKDVPISDARNAMRYALVKTDHARLESQMEILSTSSWYLKRGRLDTAGVQKAWIKKLSYAIEYGYDGLRVCGIVPWLKSKQFQDFEEYERKIDKTFARKRIITLCSYSIRKYTIEELMKALRYHGFVLIQIQDNWQLIEVSQRQPGLPTAEDYGMLTSRERQVTRLISEGLTNAEIASSLGISVRTVEAHRSNLMRKLRLKNQFDFIRFALMTSMAPPDRIKASAQLSAEPVSKART
jgi:DNA-binding CsgD family transcriptional regulator